MEFPQKLSTRDGHPALVFAYVFDQPRPWLGAYLMGDNVDGMEYIPTSWCGDGLFTHDRDTKGKPIHRGLDIPELEKKEQELKFVRAKKQEAEKDSGME